VTYYIPPLPKKFMITNYKQSIYEKIGKWRGGKLYKIRLSEKECEISLI
jgi:hypothetical protein